MTALFLYGAVLLMAASVIVNRIGRRRMVTARRSLATEETSLRAIDQGIGDTARALQQAGQRIAALDDEIHGARIAVEHLTQKYEQARAAPPERYFIFDRLDARPGVIWSVEVRRDDAPGDPLQAAAWAMPRTYLIVASNPREATDRAIQRFPRNQGYEIGNAAACHLFRNKRDGQAEDAGSGASSRRAAG